MEILQKLEMLIRTICFWIRQNSNPIELAAPLVSIIGIIWKKKELCVLWRRNETGKIKALLNVFLSIAFLLFVFAIAVIAIFIIAHDSREVPLMKGVSASSVHDTLVENGIAASVKFYWSDGDGACFLSIGENGLSDSDGEYNMDASILNDIIVASHIPEDGEIISKEGNTFTVSCKRKNTDEPENNETLELDYTSAASLENYKPHVNNGHSETTIKLPVALFQKEDSIPESCPLWNPGILTYYSGSEDGLYVWISESPNTGRHSDEQIVSGAEQYYMAAFDNAHTIDEDIDSLSIVTGFNESQKEVVYALVSVQAEYIFTLFISFPYEGILSLETYEKLPTGQFADYRAYHSYMEEDYRIKSYMVTVIYNECSFSQAKEQLVTYSDYSIVWNLPLRKET